MRKVKLTIIISLFILICAIYLRLQWYDYTVRLSDDDLVWVQTYETGDTVYFNGQISELKDTLIVVYNNAENNSLPFSTYPFDWFGGLNETGFTKMTLKHGGISYSRNNLFIMKYDEDIPCVVSWNIMGLISDDELTDATYAVKNKSKGHVFVSLTDAEIKGIAFDDCLIVNLDNSRRINYSFNDSSDTLHASEFIWSKRYGLLQYSMENETYIRTDLENLKFRATENKEPDNWWDSKTFKDLKIFIRNHLRS